ncbi:MAG TPA: tetratricopeptide repeat protein [Polyangia bacterium]|jgi:tetratricopeptide (TPR) repeat protein|nr:tetratricopeptide repeat protein [Polyangia bacterium]
MTTIVSTALAALQLRPDDPQALQALKAVHPGNGAGIDADALSSALSDARRWHREHADFELCLELIDLELGFTTTAGRRADLLHEKARLLSDELLRDEAGQTAVRQALEAVANHKASTESLAQMTLVRANWEPISRRYLKQAEEAKDPALASSLHGSVAEFYLKYRPTGPEGETHLRKSLELDAGNRRSGAHLERILREAGRREELLALYLQRAERAPTREERTAAEVSAGELSEQLGRGPEAFAHFRKALEANAYEPRALRAVRAALTASEAWAELAKVLEAAARTKRGEQDVPLLIELATLFSQRLSQTDIAESFFRRVRKLDPSNREMVEFYRAYHTARNEMPQLLAVLAQAQKTETDLDRRVAMGVEMARAAEQRSQNADKAIEIWKGLLRLRPHLPEAVASLRKLYTATEKWNALLELLKDDLDAVPAGDVDERINRHLEIVAVYRDRLNLDVMVVTTYLNILALKPDHPAALTALAGRYEAQGRYGDLVQILARQAEGAVDPAARVALHRRIASLWADKLGKHQNAVASFEKIFEADPTDAETAARLKDLYTKGRAWRPLIEVMRKELPHVDGAGRRARLTEMARLAGERLNDTREAISLYNQVLAIEGRDEGALAGLATLYERERRWPAMVEILERQRQNAEGNPAAELALLERRGTLLYERMGASEAAIEVFRRIQALDGKNARAARALREIYAQAGDYTALEALYAEQGAYGELCDQLTSLADRTADMNARTRLLERVAALSQEKLNQPERALKAFERILATDPRNRQAALSLVPLYRAAQKWPRLLATYEVLLGPAATGDGVGMAERLELHAEARRISEQRLGSKALAFQWCARAFEAAPKNSDVRTDLERLAGEADEWGALTGLYESRLAASTDAEERIWLLRRMLRISATRLFKPQDTRRAAELILSEVGYDEEAEGALETVLTQAKAWPELAKLLHARADRAPDAAERVKLLLRIAQIEEERVADLAAAAATWSAILDVEPANERARRALVRVSEARQDWKGVVEALRRDLAVRGGAPEEAKEREELLLRIGNLQETRLNDVEGTFASYREVAQANPYSAPAIAGLERLAAAGHPERAAIARMTLPLYERTDNAAKLAQANEVLLSVADTLGERVDRLERLRALYAGALADPAKAYRASLALFEIDPSEIANRDALLGFAAAAGLSGELGDKLRAAATATDDRNLRRDLLVVVAELEEKQAGRAPEAEKVYAQILGAEPLHAGAFRALARLYRDGQRWSELRALYDARQLAALDARERLDLLAQIAELSEAALSDPDHALGAYEKMLELDPADLRAHRALERLYAARERWTDLEALLGTRVGFASETEVPELEFRRADLRAGRLDNVPGALDLLEAIVKTAPNHEGARRLLEKLLAVPAQRQRVAKILEPVYEASSAWARLAAILEVQREAVQGPGAAALLARVADLQENKLQARAVALTTWRQVLTADPENPDALPEIERLGTALERFSELVEVYQEQAFRRDASDVSGRADLLSRAAKLYVGRLNNRRAAIDAWKLVLNLDQENLATAAPAAAALEALYADTGDVANLVKTLELEARWADGAAARKQILFRIAGLEEKSLGDIEAAVATLRAILELDPQDHTAIDALDRIFEAGANHRQRVEILRKRIGLAGDAAARQELWRSVASLLEKDVGDVDEAIAACVSILDENPEDDQALETLARLYDQQGRHRDRLEIVERRLLLRKPKDAERVVLLKQIAKLLEGPLGDPAGALERWREILERAPGDAEALAAIERLLAPSAEGGLRLAAAQILEPIYEKGARYAELAAIVRIYVEAQTDARARLGELMRLAALEETRLGDTEGALRTTALAIRDALTEPELPALLDAFERLSGPKRLAEVTTLYRDISPDVLDEALKLRLDRTIAAAAAGQGDVATAADYYRRILDRVPDDDAALAALDTIYRGSGDAEALYEVLVRRAELAKDPGTEGALRVQIGELAESKLERLEEAIAAFERVVEIAPADRAAGVALDRLYTKTERWGDLSRLLVDLLQRGRRPEKELVDLRFRLAQIEHDRRGDREAALEHLKLVLAGAPDHAGAISMLEGMLDDMAVQGAAATLLEPVYAGRGDWKSLIKIGEIRLLLVEDPTERLSWTKRIARLYEEQLEDFDSALRWYGKVFQEAPTERQATEPLLRLADKLDRWQDAASLLANYLDGELSEEPPVLDIVRRTAEIFDLRLGERAEAQKYYRRLFDARPDDRATTQLLEAALERWGAWTELRELIDEQAGRAPDPIARVALLRRSAKLDEEKLDDANRAVGTLREALEVDPTDRKAAAELERLLSQAGRWSDLADHLNSSLDREPLGADKDAATLRLAEILANRIGDTTSAVDRYAEILSRPAAPRDTATAVGALEGLARDADQRYRVAVILEPVYRRTGDLNKLVGALDAQLESADDRAERVRVLGEMAELHQRLGRLDLAFDCRSRAWLADVESDETLAAMESLGLGAKLHAPLVVALQKGAVEAIDPDLQARLWIASAKLLESPLGHAADAIEAWRAALAAKPDERDSFLALERLLAGAGRPSELVEVLERHLEMAVDGDERKVIAKRIAVLYEDALKESERAVRAWETVLEIDPNEGEALESLAQLHLGAGAYRELAEVYARKIEITDRADERRMLFMQSARVYEENLADPDRAIEQLRALLVETPGDGEALADLDRVLTAEGRQTDLLEVIDSRAAGAKDAAGRDELEFRAARLVETELSDVEGAIGRYARILAASPQHAGARDALYEIARGGDYRLPAIAVLEPVERAAKRWDGVVELLELRLAAEDAVENRLALLGEIARIEETERRDVRLAFAAWARALTEDATVDEPREALERLAAATKDWGRLADVYAERMEATFDAGLQRMLAMRLASLYENELPDLDRAADYLRKAQSLPGDEEPALAALERVLGKLGKGAEDELGQVLAREAELASAPTVQADFLAALGALRVGPLGDAEGALSAFRDAVERDPTHAGAHAALVSLLDRPETQEGALDVLEPLAEARGDYQELVALYGRRVELRDDRTERAHWLRKIADVAADQLHQPDLAIEALGRALIEEPAASGALDDLERIAGVAKLPAAGAKKIEEALAGAEPAAAQELALRAARLYQEAGDRAAAERLYIRVLDHDGENADALLALEGLYRAGAAPAQLAAILERRSAAELDPQVRRTRLFEAARLHEARGDLPAAVAAMRLLQAADEEDLDALKELARLYEALGQAPELTAVLAERARLTEDPRQRAQLWSRVGELRLTLLNDLDAAAEAYREALDGAPDDALALSALEAIEDRRGDWSTLQEVLLRRLGSASGADEVAVLLKLARNAEQKLSDIDQAVGFLRQLLDTDPGNGFGYLELERILRAAERWYDLVDVLGKHADMEAAAGRKPTELALRVAVANVWEKDLDSPESAAEALEKVLEVAPDNVAALLSLARLHERNERWDEAGAALERAAQNTHEPAEIAEIHFRNATILRSKEAGPEEIEAALLRAIDADAGHRPALEALEKIAREAKDEERLANILDLQLHSAPDDGERRRLLREIAGLYGGPLAQPAAALPYLERLVALDPTEIPGREQLAEALIAAGRTDQATRIIGELVAELTKARRGKETARWQTRLGTIAEMRGDAEGAAASFNAAYKLDPSHPATIAALGRLAYRRSDFEAARKFYRSLLLQNFDDATAGVSKSEVYLMLGRMHVLANETPKARNMFERGLEIDPKNVDLKAALAGLG